MRPTLCLLVLLLAAPALGQTWEVAEADRLIAQADRVLGVERRHQMRVEDALAEQQRVQRELLWLNLYRPVRPQPQTIIRLSPTVTITSLPQVDHARALVDQALRRAGLR